MCFQNTSNYFYLPQNWIVKSQFQSEHDIFDGKWIKNIHNNNIIDINSIEC